MDPLKKESIDFIKKHIQNILKYSNNNIFIIANIKFSNNDPIEKIWEAQKNFAENDKFIKELVEKLEHKVYYININKLENFKNSIKKFLSLTYIKKGITNWKKAKKRSLHNNKNKISNASNNNHINENDIINNNLSKYERKSMFYIKQEVSENFGIYNIIYII